MNTNVTITYANSRQNIDSSSDTLLCVFQIIKPFLSLKVIIFYDNFPFLVSFAFIIYRFL